MKTFLRAFTLAGVFGLCLAAMASAQTIPIGTTLSCPSGKIYVESCNIRDTSDNSTCLVGHPDTVGPNGLMSYTNETRGTLKQMLPNCQKAAPAQAATNNPAPAPSAPAGSVTSGAPIEITSVSIKNSPGVPDIGGHSILGGLLRGSLTAVLPNLFLCVTPAGGRRTCTDVCPPGHDCTKPLGGGIRFNGAGTSVHLEVMDNDNQGHIATLGTVDFMDATMCTQAQPCTHTFPDQTSPDPAHGTDSTIYFELKTIASAAPAGSGLTRSTMTASGKLPTSTLTLGAQLAQQTDPKCHGPYKSVNAAVMSDPFGPEALKDTAPGATEYGFVIVRDPKYSAQKPGNGGYYVTPPVRSGAGSSTVHPILATDDYQASQNQAACGANSRTFKWAATVHTHPSAWRTGTPFNSDFTPDDFSQGVQLKMNNPNGFEEIVMIYVGDSNVRMFQPLGADCPADAPRHTPDCQFACCPFGNSSGFVRTVPILSSLWNAWSAGDRTIVIGHYP